MLADQPLTALIIGAGFAGIAAAIKLRQAGITDFIIAEKTDGISGTWYDNAYPGAACDVPSHLYSYSFAPNPHWSRRFSPASEIRKYVEDVVVKYGLAKHIRPLTEITSAIFDEKRALWTAQTKDGEQIEARFLITSVAVLGTPQFPDIKGMDSFKGPTMHSALWDHSVDLANKRIAVIGSAASAVQIVPKLAKICARVLVLQRTANWIVPRMDRPYSKFEKTMFRYLPFTMKLTRLAMQAYLEHVFFRVFKKQGQVNGIFKRNADKYRARKIKDENLRQKLTPDYPIGCKRVLLSDDFYDTLLRDNVDLITDEIERITADGIKLKNGQDIKADILVYATGFKTTEFLPYLALTGLGGAKLSDWRKSPKAHKGLVIENMPNALFLLGPNTGLGHASMILMIEAQTPSMLQLIQATKKGQYFTVKPEAVKAYNRDIQARLATSIWATSCQSWYKTKDGTIPILWPYPAYTYKRMMRKVDWDEYTVSG
ncbi:MAG: 4-hydroxyacetophenone monooxygenase [Robiginitomaculum sp.]|nr:MAG: 4-hydroxyacetophenone monooxygenase [Robiginitomaculum sp.]